MKSNLRKDLLQAVLSKMNGKKILILYNSSYLLRCFLFCEVLPYFSSKNLYFIIFSDIMHRRLKETYESFKRVKPEIAEIFDRARIIKVGSKRKTEFGKLCNFIALNEYWYKELPKIIINLSEKDILITHGFSILPILHKDFLKVIVQILDILPENITFISKFPKDLEINLATECKFLNRLFDMVLRVEESEDYFSKSYLLHVDESILVDFEPITIRLDLPSFLPQH